MTIKKLKFKFPEDIIEDINKAYGDRTIKDDMLIEGLAEISDIARELLELRKQELKRK